MAGLTQEQFKALKKQYQALRDAGSGGPLFPGEDLARAIREIETLARQPGGDTLAKFIEMARARRAVMPNPLEPKAPYG